MQTTCHYEVGEVDSYGTTKYKLERWEFVRNSHVASSYALSLK